MCYTLHGFLCFFLAILKGHLIIHKQVVYTFDNHCFHRDSQKLAALTAFYFPFCHKSLFITQNTIRLKTSTIFHKKSKEITPTALKTNIKHSPKSCFQKLLQRKVNTLSDSCLEQFAHLPSIHSMRCHQTGKYIQFKVYQRQHLSLRNVKIGIKNKQENYTQY